MVATTKRQAQQTSMDAIIDRCVEVYGREPDAHFATTITYDQGGDDPLDAFVVYRSDSITPHWHYVSLGFSDLYSQHQDLAEGELSGYGFELSMRLIAWDDEPPTWPLQLMQSFAQYVFSTGRVFKANQYIPLNGPMILGTDTRLTGVLFGADLGIDRIVSASGEVKFVQIFGVTDDELSAARNWNVGAFLEMQQRINPLLIVDPERDCTMELPFIRQTVEERSEAEGTSIGTLYVEEFTWSMVGTQLCIDCNVLGAQALLAALTRVRQGKVGRLVADGGRELVLKPAPAWNLTLESESGISVLSVSQRELDSIQARLISKVGSFSWSFLWVIVRPASIRNQQGELVDTIYELKD